MISTPDDIRKAGIKALVEELGVSGMLRFIQQCEMGEGDYTKDRQKIKSEVSMEEIEGFLTSHND